jgi:hypothetical protein
MWLLLNHGWRTDGIHLLTSYELSWFSNNFHFYWAGQPTLQSQWKNILYHHKDWILMNFPYNLVTSCTSIEQVNLPPSHIGQIYYINTGIVTLLAHILCDSYWIIGDGRIEYIYWLLVKFPDNFLTGCTSIEQVNLPYSHIAKMYYINTGIVTFLAHILCVSYWIMGDGRM